MIAVTVIFIIMVGFIPALAITNRSILAVPLCGATTGLICAMAAMSALASRTALLPWVLAWAVVAACAGAWQLRRTGRHENTPTVTGLAMAIVALFSLPLLVGLRSAPTAWDARSIWFFHGLWFQAGGERAAAAMTNEAFAFSHPDYPPLAPATNGALWSLYRGGDRWVGMTVNVWLTLSAAMVVGVLLVTIARRRAQPLAAVVGGLVVTALFGTTDGTALTGLVDLLWAAWVVAAALALLVLAPTSTNRLIGATCLAAAGLTKAEGLALGLLVLIAVAGRHRHQLRLVLAPLVAFAPALAWTALARTLGAKEGGAFNVPGISGLLSGDPQRWERVRPTLRALGGQLYPFSFLCVAAMLVVGLRYYRHRRQLLVGSAGWLLGLVGAGLGVFAFIYVTGVFDLSWWLATSVDRTTISVRALVLTELAVWLVVALDRVLCGEPLASSPAIGCGQESDLAAIPVDRG